MKFSKKLFSLAFAGLLTAAPGFANNQNTPAPMDQATLEKNVNHAIQTLPYYGVFDALGFTVDTAGKVTLTGQVARYVVNRDAVTAVKRVAGVTSVDNQIEVLPLSRYDDDIRLRAYASIFGYPALSRYIINARSPIRILVKNGNVTLAGVVTNEMDRKLVEYRVRSLPYTFQVINELRVEGATS